jgi:hypothetical protein
MRSLASLTTVATFLCWNTAACVAQQAAEPATLEKLVLSGEAQGTPSAPSATASGAGLSQPAGAVVRPKGGIRRPELDKAWAEYDAVVTKAAEGLRAALSKQFDAATAKGDLEAASRLQESRKRFEQRGEMPRDKEATGAVASARSSFAKANAALKRAYKELTESITKEKRIDDARLVDGEMKQLVAAMEKEGEQHTGVSISPQRAQELASQVLAMTEEEWLRIRGAVFTVSGNPINRCETGIELQKDDKYLFLPCPTDRWNSSPTRIPDADFRGHTNRDRTKDGMPYMRLCYSVDDGPLRYVLETSNVTGMQGNLRFMPSDFNARGSPENNSGSVRVKVIPIR